MTTVIKITIKGEEMTMMTIILFFLNLIIPMEVMIQWIIIITRMMENVTKGTDV
uniref:Uncharacterized protein n=1 Tax=Moniliophthora roreri TaxID=221103 RepID=A0A0W0FET9_MONRR